MLQNAAGFIRRPTNNVSQQLTFNVCVSPGSNRETNVLQTCCPHIHIPGLSRLNFLSKSIPNSLRICPSAPRVLQSQFLKQINTQSVTNLSVRAERGLSRANFLSKLIANPLQICPSEPRALQSQFLKQINTKSNTNLSIRAQGSPESIS